MSSYVINISALLTSLVVFFMYETGAMATHNAFFIAAAVLVAYTAYQLIQREGMRLSEALHAVVRNPQSYPRQTAYWAYVVSASIGLIVVGQTLAVAIA